LGWDCNINHKVNDVKYIIGIQNQIINSAEKQYVILFGNCSFLDAAVSVLIGTLPIYSALLEKRVRFLFSNANNPVFEFIKSIGIYDFFTNSNKTVSHVKSWALPFDRILDEDTMETYTDKIIALAPIMMNAKANAILSSYFYEIYQNSFSHSESPIGVFSCGYWMKDHLIFSIYDMGVGIPQNVRKHIDNTLSSEKCVKWAFEEGNTTLDETIIKRGLGLSRLETFIQLNKGYMAMYTDDVCYVVNSNKKELHVLDIPIKGTLFIIRIKADDRHIYVVNDER